MIIVVVVVFITVTGLNERHGKLFQTLNGGFVDRKAVNFDVVIVTSKGVNVKTEVTHRTIQPEHRFVFLVD